MWGFGSSNSNTAQQQQQQQQQHPPSSTVVQSIPPPPLAQTTSSASSATTVSSSDNNHPATATTSQALSYTYKIQIFPHRDTSQTVGTPSLPGLVAAQQQRFHFEPIERDLKPGMVLKIGRKVDKKANASAVPENSTDDAAAAAAAPGALDMSALAAELPPSYQSTSGFVQASGKKPPTTQPQIDFIAFKSKVVSRAHAELWVTDDGQVMFKDVGSSSGTWVNRHRLSASGKESRAYVVKSGDVVQLGMDYQGRQEDMYKSVVMRIFVTMRSKDPPKPNPSRLRASLRALLSAMNPSSISSQSTSCTDCCICLSPLSPIQTLFLAPCSHCFHFRCVMPLIGSSVMFQCPLCRQVANLEKGVGEDEDSLYEDDLGSGAAVGETSLEEWLGVLSVDGAFTDQPRVNNLNSLAVGPSGVSVGVADVSDDDDVDMGAGSGESAGPGSDGDVLKGLEDVLGDVFPGADEGQKKLALERIRQMLETRK